MGKKTIAVPVPAPLTAPEPQVYLTPGDVLTFTTPGGHRVEALHGDHLVLKNDRGRLVLSLWSGSQRHHVESNEVPPGHVLHIDVGLAHGHAELPVQRHGGKGTST